MSYTLISHTNELAVRGRPNPISHEITNVLYVSSNYENTAKTPGGVLLGIFGGGVPPASPNPDPISDQKIPFPIPVSRPGFKNPYPFSDLILYVIKHSKCISAERNST